MCEESIVVGVETLERVPHLGGNRDEPTVCGSHKLIRTSAKMRI